MDTKNDLRKLRASKGWTADDAAAAMGMSASGYTKIERGERQLTQNTLSKAALAFGVGEDVILGLKRRAPSPYTSFDEPYWSASGPKFLPPEPKDISGIMPVYRTVRGDGVYFVIAAELVVDRFKRPHLLESVQEAYGFVVADGSMSPAYEVGDYVLVNPWEHIYSGVDVLLIAKERDKRGNGRAALCRLIEYEQSSDLWNVEQHRNSKEEWDKVEWPTAHRVVGRYNRR